VLQLEDLVDLWCMVPRRRDCDVQLMCSRVWWFQQGAGQVSTACVQILPRASPSPHSIKHSKAKVATAADARVLIQLSADRYTRSPGRAAACTHSYAQANQTSSAGSTDGSGPSLVTPIWSHPSLVTPIWSHPSLVTPTCLHPSLVHPPAPALRLLTASGSVQTGCAPHRRRSQQTQGEHPLF
jgi:hypothetical protein